MNHDQSHVHILVTGLLAAALFAEAEVGVGQGVRQARLALVQRRQILPLPGQHAVLRQHLRFLFLRLCCRRRHHLRFIAQER